MLKILQTHQLLKCVALVLQMTPLALQKLGAPRPLEAALMACLWVAAKLEECRLNLPSATKVWLLQYFRNLRQEIRQSPTIPPTSSSSDHV